MRRRGHKSSKVPNVKLRPAQEGSVVRRLESVLWAEDSQAGSDDTSVMDTCPRPFKDFIICATGVVDKPTLFRQALELGATSVNAFTDRVTHLIAVDHGGAKYMCALERKIPILKPSWILESYQVWLRGDDVDLIESTKQHRLPIFSDVFLCLSGINDITRRTLVHKLVTQNGGVYLKALERPVKVTHLLCSGDEETDKMVYAEKFNERGEANIHLVWEEWFWDSLEFGGRFDEAKYQVCHPRPERKSASETATSPPLTPAAPSEWDETHVTSKSHQTKPPQTNEDDQDEDELASVNVVPAVTLRLWGDLLQRRGYQVSGGEVVRSPTKSQNQPRQRTPPLSPTTPPRQGGSVISSFRRANSFALPDQNDTRPSQRMPFRRTSTFASILQKQQHMSQACASEASFRASVPKNGESSSSSAGKSSTTGSMFLGYYFRALAEANSPSVRNAIEQYGGTIVSDGDENANFIIVRLVSGSKLFRDEPDETIRSKFRTECWLERCIYEDRLCPVEEHVFFVPLQIEIPIPDADRIVMSLSGFDQSEACGIKRLLRALGITLASSFSRKSTHLLCSSETGLKFQKASEWGIPVVNTSWLASISTTGIIPPTNDCLVPRKYHQNGAAIVADQSKGKGKALDKEKGRAIDPLNRPAEINALPDITNNCEPDIDGPLDTESDPSKAFSFGQPTSILGGLNPNNKSFATTPPQSQLSLSAHQLTRQNSLAVSVQDISDDSAPARQPTLLEIESQRKNDRIPSSKSPSPMKLPRNGSRLSLSPVKIDHEATKALQESITSLLGKRPSPEEDEHPKARNGKRGRPHRLKPPSRQNSDAQLSAIAAFPFSHQSPYEFESCNELQESDGGLDESMRVLYEDPAQRDEKKRLMNLLKNQADELGSTEKGKAGKARRSARIAGF